MENNKAIIYNRVSTTEQTQPTKMKLAGYIRCSTTKQDLESQENIIKEYAKRSYGELIEIYKDFAISGKTTNRERAGCQKMLDDGGAKKFEALVVPELSRIGRSIRFIHDVIDDLNKLDIKVILANTGTILSPNSVEGTALLGGLALAAAVELKLIEERNRRGREKIKRLGIKTGRKCKEETGLSVEAVKALRDKGLSMRLIGKELNTSPATIMRIIHSLESGHKTNIQQSNQNTDKTAQKDEVFH